jgi:hypothetical protein
LLNREQQPHPRGDDRERRARARLAAEALFKSKPPVSISPIPETAAASQAARKPRVLQVVSAPPPPEIPRSQFVRIQTWVKYGMTVAQVAQVYGVAAGDIERVLGKKIGGG